MMWITPYATDSAVISAAEADYARRRDLRLAHFLNLFVAGLLKLFLKKRYPRPMTRCKALPAKLCQFLRSSPMFYPCIGPEIVVLTV